jgi:hypothetical protein
MQAYTTGTMAATRTAQAGGRTAKGPSFARAVFDAVVDRLASRADAIALFTETGGSFEGWCVWEALAGCRAAGWAVRPQPPYADCGVAGSRDAADLSVFDPATGRSVLVEITVLCDWTTNKWIDQLDGDTQRLTRAAAAGTPGAQLILAASLASPIEVNPKWLSWLAMCRIWKEPSDMRRSVPLGPVGELLARGWAVGP